jgi:hypothetical protein
MNDADPTPVAWASWMGEDTSSGVEHYSDARDFLEVLHCLALLGRGYAEVSRGHEPFPRVTVSVASGWGVVHLFPSADECHLLHGDGAVPEENVIELPVMGEPAIFSGEFVLPRGRAIDLVEAFVRGTPPSELGYWVAL